jgi:hypothetical protein
MPAAKTQLSNFSHLAVHDERLVRLGALAHHSAGPNPRLLMPRKVA